MTPGHAIGSGVAAAGRNKWMVTLFYGANLLVAAALAAPMYSAIAQHVGHSRVGEELARGFNAAWLVEFTISNADFLKGFSTSIAYAGIIFLALNAVLSAGAFEVFAQGEGAKLHAFGRGVGKYFGSFARVVLVASFFYFVVFWFFNGPLDRWLDRAFRDSTADRWHFTLNLVRVALTAFLVMVVNMMVDYAKAEVVTGERASALGALGQGAGFVIGRFGRVLAIYAALAVMSLLTIAVYLIFARYVPQSSVLTVLVWFLVAQALLWVRWMLRLASWGAAVSYYKAVAAERGTGAYASAAVPERKQVQNRLGTPPSKL